MNQTVRGGWFYGADGWSARRGGYYDSPDRGNFLGFRIAKRKDRSRVLRGGCWYIFLDTYFRCDERFTVNLASHFADVGFRVARRKS